MSKFINICRQLYSKIRDLTYYFILVLARCGEVFKLISKYLSHMFKSKIISYVKLLVKVLCLSVLFYSGIEVTKEYFSYPYVYRLSVESNKGLDLPPITVCTERYVYFDKTRINTHFNLTKEYKAYKQFVKNKTNILIKNCYKREDNYLCNIL